MHRLPKLVQRFEVVTILVCLTLGTVAVGQSEYPDASPWASTPVPVTMPERPTKLPSTTAPAPEPMKPLQAATQQASHAAQNVKSHFLGAIKGNPDAMQKLLGQYLVPAILALMILMGGYMLSAFAGRITGQLVSSRVDLTLGKFVGRMTTNLLLLLTGLGVLGYFRVDVSCFAAILAAAGFAVGMAMQGTLANFAAGVMLLVFRPFKVDDFIKVAGIEGSVDEIDLFTTRLDTVDNRHIIIPNGQVFGAVIENYTRNQVRRVDVNVGVAYAADLRHTRQVLTNAIAVIPGAVTHPEPQVYLQELADSSVNWQLRVWCRPSNYWEVRQRVTMAAKESLESANISIPFPQLDLHVVSDVAAKRAA